MCCTIMTYLYDGDQMIDDIGNKIPAQMRCIHKMIHIILYHKYKCP